MINIVTDKKEIQGKLLEDNESFFHNFVSIHHLNSQYFDVMLKIDQAHILDRDSGLIKTPIGLTSFENLSTGCKTVINCLYLRDYRGILDIPFLEVVRVTECGYNALNVLFEYGDLGLVYLLEHNNLISQINNGNFCLNRINVNRLGDVL